MTRQGVYHHNGPVPLRAWKPFSCAVLLSVSGCAPPPEPAPAALADNLRWHWLHAADAEDAALLDGMATLSVAAKAESREAPLKGQLPLRLAREDLLPVGMVDGEDPARARGLLLLNPLPGCSLAAVAPLLTSAHPSAFHPDLYDAYDRTFDGDEAAFLEGRVDRLGWDARMQAHFPVDDRYSASLRGELRRVNGRLLVKRGWFKGPATFAEGSASRFPQDYGVELFFEPVPGRLFHALAAWREVRIGALGLTTEDDGVFSPMLDRLLQLDGELGRACAGGG